MANIHERYLGLKTQSTPTQHKIKLVGVLDEQIGVEPLAIIKQLTVRSFKCVAIANSQRSGTVALQQDFPEILGQAHLHVYSYGANPATPQKAFKITDTHVSTFEGNKYEYLVDLSNQDPSKALISIQ